MKVPKRHHYLPLFYLKGFCEGKFLWVYDRETSQFRKQTPKDTTVESNYYSRDGEKIIKDMKEVEDILSSVEGRTKPILDKIHRRETLTLNDRKILSRFVSFLKVRVPKFQEETDEFDNNFIKELIRISSLNEKKIQSVIAEIEKETGERLGVSSQEMIELFQSKNYRIKIGKNFNLLSMIVSVNEFYKYLLSMDWMFLFSDETTSFITTDNPFILIPPLDYDLSRGVGILTKGTKKLVPLSHKVCLIMSDIGKNILYTDSNERQVFLVNCNLSINCKRFLIGSSENILKTIIEETKINQVKK